MPKISPRCWATLLVCLVVAGCGYRGALYLPEEDSQNQTPAEVNTPDAAQEGDL